MVGSSSWVPLSRNSCQNVPSYPGVSAPMVEMGRPLRMVAR